MKLPLRHTTGTGHSRGQALVEFALILPILVLLLVIALDFGRIFFGWVSVTNAARVGANYAGSNPNLLTKPAQRDEFEQLVANSVVGCNLDPADLNDPAYDPVFTDVDGDGKSNGWGDTATVTLSCEFDLMTPLAGAIVGDPVPMNAEAVFPIRFGSFAGPGGGGGGGNPPCTLAVIPDLINRSVAEARQKWIDNGFDPARFGASPNIDDYLVNAQVFTPSASVNDCADPSGQNVFVTAVPPPPCAPGFAQVPDLIGDLVADARTEWTAAGFTGQFNPTSADNSKTVLTQSTNPATSPPIGGCAPVTATVTITYGDPPPAPCDVPNMIGSTLAQAQALWTGAGFTTTLTSQGPNGGSVNQQTPTHPGTVSCDIVGQVRLRN